MSCIGCNYNKSIKTELFEPISQQTVPLFNPRTMVWNDHFMWDETTTTIIGITAIGRATIEALKLNRQEVKNLRFALISIGIHPPK